MFNASNLNDLYSRFDQKCFKTLNGLSPLFGTELTTNSYGLPIPYGVVYQYRKDPATCRRLAGADGYLENYDQRTAYTELSKLENKHLDVDGGQVYVDKYILQGDDPHVNVKAIHFSFELLKREVAGIQYDIHLGWDTSFGGLTSGVRGSLGTSIPTLPPGRIHKHKIAVADIWIEGYETFSILNTWQRYDCWRVHNCSASPLKVKLQNGDGGFDTITIEAASCKAFRRKPNNTWATTWGDGTACRYFFPYFTSDIPFFAAGPPFYDSPFVAIENSAAANNVGNPFLLLRWQTVMFGVLDPELAFDIRKTYPKAYADPANPSSQVGDCVFTWGRAKVVKYNIASNTVIDTSIKVFEGMESFKRDLDSIGISTTETATTLGLTSKTPNIGIRIFPIDANIFGDGNIAAGETIPYWQAGPTISYINSTVCTGGYSSFFETIKDLRRRVAVAEGYLATYDEVDDVTEELVSKVTLTPLGLFCKTSKAAQISTSRYSILPEYELWADSSELRTVTKKKGDVGPYFVPSTTRTVNGTRNWNLSGARAMPSLPAGTFSQNPQYPAFVPPGGPWGFASLVYDAELSRVFQTTTGGTDFWVNKWGGKGGTDATVRVLGQPDRTWQTPIQTTTQAPSLVRDDVFKDPNVPLMAGTAGSVSLGAAVANLAQYNVKNPLQYFDLPYAPSGLTSVAGTGPIFHKIPKSPWLWNLLEWCVSAWTRSIPLCLGQYNAPMLGGTRLADVIDCDALNSSNETGRNAFLISEAQHDILLTNGIQAFSTLSVFGAKIYWVAAEDLANFCDSLGFKAYNFDTLDNWVAPTLRLKKRAYSQGEQSELVDYFNSDEGKMLYRSIRYVAI